MRMGNGQNELGKDSNGGGIGGQNGVEIAKYANTSQCRLGLAVANMSCPIATVKAFPQDGGEVFTYFKEPTSLASFPIGCNGALDGTTTSMWGTLCRIGLKVFLMI